MPEFQNFEDELSYELLRPIAQGGMGCVYEALQQGHGDFRKRVALKLIREEYARHGMFRKNFVGEARLVADLIHSNIVQTYHLGTVEETYYMVMEYVHGINLEQFNLQHRALGLPVPWRLAAFIISRVCRGLSYAHLRRDADGCFMGIVHRDVSPRNIMLSYTGDVKLTDFGIAKAFNLMYSKEGEVIAGRSEYLSPEQARMEVTDLRADLFSCGVVLLEMLLGYNIFAEDEPAASRDNICSMPFPNLKKHLPEEAHCLIPIIRKALAQKREARYQEARALMGDIERVVYRDGYGPTSEKLSLYLIDLYKEGQAYVEDRNDMPTTADLPV